MRTDQMIMMLTIVELKNRLATIKLTARQNTGLFKLGQHAIHSRQADVYTFTYQYAIHIFCAEVALSGPVKDVQDFQARECSLEANVFKIALVVFGLQGSPLAYAP